MKAWWHSLSLREQRLLWWVTIIVVLFVAWLAVWRPITAQSRNLEFTRQTLEADIGWLQAAGAEISRLESGGAGRAARGNQSLLALVESSARGAGMENTFRRGEPAGPGQVRVWLENASFDVLVRWLEVLDSRYGVQPAEAAVDRAGVPGLVNARLTLVEAGAAP